MAATLKTNVTAQVPQLWATELYSQAEYRTFWHRFEGPEGSSMPIIRKDDLAKAAGDTIKYDMVLALTGAGVVGDASALMGNEEALKFRQTSLAVVDLAWAVRWSELAQAEITHDMRGSALNQLQKWLAGKIDNAIWNELTGSGVTTLPAINQYFCGGVANDAAIGTSDYLKLNDISNVKAYAQAALKIEPIRVEGDDEFFGLACHPYALLQLKNDANYQQAVREAQVRGDQNPLFTGSAFVWDGVVGYASSRVPLNNGGSGGVQVAENVLFGAQALCRGYAQYPDWREEFFDYGRQAGVATTLIKGEKLNVFDLSAAGDGSANTAIGMMRVDAYAAAPTL